MNQSSFVLSLSKFFMYRNTAKERYILYPYNSTIDKHSLPSGSPAILQASQQLYIHYLIPIRDEQIVGLTITGILLPFVQCISTTYYYFFLDVFTLELKQAVANGVPPLTKPAVVLFFKPHQLNRYVFLPQLYVVRNGDNMEKLLLKPYISELKNIHVHNCVHYVPDRNGVK